MKKIFTVIGIIVLCILCAGGIFVATYTPEKHSDFGVFTNLRRDVPEILNTYNVKERAITRDFEDFMLSLSFPYNKLFGSSSIGVPLLSYESDTIAAATISQFEVPPNSGYYRDFTINIRPQYAFKAPVFHMDFMKPAPGTPGLCTIDFFNVDKENISFENFFGYELDAIRNAYSRVEKFQRTKEEGRGKITKYLDPYKSPYRMELIAPDSDDQAILKKYYLTVEKTFREVVHAYLKSLQKAPHIDDYAKRHEEKMQELVRLIYVNDFAVKMGKKMFKEQFRKYWIDGFWYVNADLPG